MPVFLFERSKEIVRHLQHLPDTLRDGDLVTGYNILKDQVNNIKIQFIRETVKEDLSAALSLYKQSLSTVIGAILNKFKTTSLMQTLCQK